MLNVPQTRPSQGHYPGLPADDFMRQKSPADFLREYGSELVEVDPKTIATAINTAMRRATYVNWDRAEELAEALDQVDPDAAEKLRMCFDKKHGRIEYCPSDPNHHARYIPVSCDLRVCPVCAERHAKRAFLRYETRLDLVASMKVPGWRMRHLTLTQKLDWDLDIEAQYDAHIYAVKRVLKHFWLRGDKRAGALAAVEFGPQGGNIHSHIIIYGGWVDWADIRDYWEKLTDNTSVYITQLNGAGAALAEALKYATKPLGYTKTDDGDVNPVSLSIEQLVKIHLALKGKRRVQSFGSLFKGAFLKQLAQDKGVNIDDDKPVAQTHCEACSSPLQIEPYAIMESFLAKLRGPNVLILRKGINFNILGDGEPGRPPPNSNT